MQTNGPNYRLSENKRQFLYLTLFLLFVIRVTMMISTPLADTTESRYAEIGRKMVETNNWITPQYDYGVPFWAKPPLSTWASALGMKLFGVNQFGSRFFLFVIGIAMCLMTYQWLKKLRDRDYALIVVTILASTTIFFISAGMVITDLAMVCGTSISMMAFWTSMHSDQRRSRSGYLFFVGLAIGLLAKGPVAVVLTGIPIFLWVLLNNEWKKTWSKIPWISGLAIMCVLALPWYILAERATPGFINYFIIGEHFNRFVVSGWEGDLYGHAHSRTIGTIWVYWLLTTLPWSPLILVCAVKAYIHRKKLSLWKQGWLSYLILWTIAPLLFFTPARNIIPSYSLSAVVGCAILTLELWTLVHGKASENKQNAVYLSSVGFSFIAFITVFILFTYMPEKTSKFSANVVIDALKAHSHSTYQPLYFYGKNRSYSVEFYTRGRVIRVPDTKALTQLLENESRDYLCINPDDYKRLEAEFRDRFKVVKSWQKQILLQEIPSNHLAAQTN